MKILTKGKYFLFPFILILVVLILSLLHINGSSVGIYANLINEQTMSNSNLLFGHPRAIRGDNFLVGLPTIISQDINNEPLVNTDMGEGTNLGTQSLDASSGIFTIFRPASFIFYLSNNTTFSYSFFWWFEMTLMVIAIYFLLLELTKKNLWISIIGSLLFLLTPFTQWWNNFGVITWISFGIFFFLKLLSERNWKRSVLYGLGLSYSIVTFVLILYPPFQIPLIYVALAIAVGSIISQWKDILKNVKTILPVLVGVIIIAAGFLLLYTTEFRDIINITKNTVYPGARFVKAGGGDENLLFDGFYNILLQKDSNTAPFGNQSESSNFFLLFPPILIWIVYKNIILFKSKKKVDWIAITISFVLLFFLSFYFLPIPDIFSKIFLMYLVPWQRLLIGFGFASYLLMFYILSKDIYKWGESKFDWILGIFLSISYGIFIYSIGKNIYNISPNFFNFPNIVSPTYKILLASLFVAILLILLFRSHKRLFLTSILLFGFISTALINPIYRGLDILINTDLANYIEEVSLKDDSKWIAYNHNYLAQYALANNASIINGVHFYPQFKIWKVLDPNRKYIDIYNRYAHINVSEYEEGEEYIRLVYPDALEINISPCDTKWKELNAKYIITNKVMKYECLTSLKEFTKNNVYIYEIK